MATFLEFWNTWGPGIVIVVFLGGLVLFSRWRRKRKAKKKVIEEPKPERLPETLFEHTSEENMENLEDRKEKLIQELKDMTAQGKGLDDEEYQMDQALFSERQNLEYNHNNAKMEMRNKKDMLEIKYLHKKSELELLEKMIANKKALEDKLKRKEVGQVAGEVSGKG